MPLSLAEWAVGQTNKITKGVTLGIVRESVVMDIMPFSTSKQLTVTGMRYDSVITPEFVPINGTIPEKTTRGKNLSYGVYELALHMDIPEVLEMAEDQVEKPAQRQIKQAILGGAYKVNDQFINGDQGVDPNGFEGLEKLVGQLDAAQTVGASEIDISGAPTSAVIQSLVDRIDQGIYQIDGHKPSFGLLSGVAGLRIRSMFRREKLVGDHYDWVRQGFPFGNIRASLKTKSTDPVFVYNNIPFYDIGPKDDMTTQIIGNAYAEGGSAAATRIYLVKAGDDQMEMLQFSPPDVRRIGVLEDKNTERHRYTHRLGTAMWGHRSVVKIQGVKVA